LSALTSSAERLDQICWHFVSALSIRQVLASIVLGLLALVSYLPGQINLPAIDRTEGLVALSSRYVAESGDYLRPRWRANVQRTRPAGTFWAQGLSAAAHSKSARNDISTYRLPSLISTVLAVLLMFWLASRLVGPVPAFMASLAIAVTPIVVLHAQLAIAEPLILPATIVAQLALLALYRQADAASWWGWLGAFWMALGISTWFNALAVPLLALTTVLTLVAVDRQWSFIRRLQPWFGLPLLALLALPWLASVWAIDEGALYRGMSVRAILDALEGGQSMKFKTVYGVFVLTLLLGFVPVAHMLGPVVARYWRAKHDPLLRFLLVWLIAPIVALELLSNKPPLYTVQAVLPAGAMLVALAVGRNTPHAIRVKAMPGMFIGTVLLLALIAPALFGAVLWVTDTPVTAAMVIGFLLLAGLFVMAGWLSARGFGMAWFATGVSGTLILGLWFNGVLMPGLANFWTAPQLSAVVGKLESCPPAGISVSGFREPSLALALYGRARIDSPANAAKALAGGKSGYAIVESRQFDAFSRALTTANPHIELHRQGCVRSFNLARGCSLVFDVFARDNQTAPNHCPLGLPKDCKASHERLKGWLKIPHCG
jgi:4-amino-4-deoxy-L-arabinose transferase-like glycosyltransferase